MADFFNNYIAVVTLTTTNLQSLANDAFWQSAFIDNATDEYEDAQCAISIATTTTAGSATGFVLVAGYGSVDGGTIYSASASGSEGTYTNTAQRFDVLPARSFAIKADETTARTFNCPPFSLAQFFGGRLPERYGIIIKNSTGAALASSGNIVKVQKMHGRSA